MCGGEVGFGTAFGSLGFNRRERGVLPATGRQAQRTQSFLLALLKRSVEYRSLDN